MTWAEAVPLWLTIGLGMGAVIFFRRYGGGTALEELQRANTILAGRLHELERDNSRLLVEVARLRERTDVTLAVEPVREAIARHETAAASRGEAILTVLGLIAAELGSDGKAS